MCVFLDKVSLLMSSGAGSATGAVAGQGGRHAQRAAHAHRCGARPTRAALSAYAPPQAYTLAGMLLLYSYESKCISGSSAPKPFVGLPYVDQNVVFLSKVLLPNVCPFVKALSWLRPSFLLWSLSFAI